MDFVDSPQDAVLNWLRNVNRDERLQFIKEVVGCCNLDEHSGLKNIVTNWHKRKSPFPRNAEKKRRLADLQSVKFPVQTAVDTLSVVPVSSPIVPASTSSTGKPFWWEHYELKDIVAIDCEMVTLNEINPITGKHLSKLATVSIVNWEGFEIYSGMVYSKSGTFMEDTAHVEITGFQGTMLEGGISFQKVKGEVIKILDGKLVVTCGGTNDFESLEINPIDVDNFEFHNVWQKWTGGRNKRLMKVYQPIGLKRLYKHYFGKTIQKFTHSAKGDAEATMRLFKEVYVPFAKKNSPYTRNFYDYDVFNDIL